MCADRSTAGTPHELVDAWLSMERASAASHSGRAGHPATRLQPRPVAIFGADHAKGVAPDAARRAASRRRGCGGDDQQPATSAETTSESTAPDLTAPDPTTPAPTATKTTATETTATEPKPAKPRAIVIVVDQGRPRGGIERPTIQRGEKIVLVVRGRRGRGDPRPRLRAHSSGEARPARPDPDHRDAGRSVRGRAASSRRAPRRARSEAVTG